MIENSLWKYVKELPKLNDRFKFVDDTMILDTLRDRRIGKFDHNLHYSEWYNDIYGGQELALKFFAECVNDSFNNKKKNELEVREAKVSDRVMNGLQTNISKADFTRQRMGFSRKRD